MEAGPAMLFCVGATKAGTSWLYRYLHDHPGCRLRSVKELHWFDSRDFDDLPRQTEVLERLRADLAARRDGAEGWQGRNLARQVADVDELLAALSEPDPERGLALYRAYLTGGAEGRLAADITPAYALLSEARLRMMAGLGPAVRFVYLMRDPVERLWSHVRMQAARQLRPGEELALKARRILNRVVAKGQETHIPARGDYRATVEKLRAAVPAGRLLVEFTERLLTEAGLRRLCAFLGLAFRPGDTGARANEGPALALAPAQRARAAAFLAPQYDYVERSFGPLPEAWLANMARV